jgi:hypothetical protein
VSTNTIQLVLVGLTATILVTPLVWKGIRGRLDVFEPIVIFAIAYGVMFVARPLDMIVRGDFLFRAPLSVLDVRSTFTRMLVLALLGALGFVIGYLSPAGAKLAAKADRRRAPDLGVASYAAGAIAIVAVAFFGLFLMRSGGLNGVALLFQGRTDRLTNAMKSLSFYPWTATLMLVPAALVLLGIALKRRQKLLLFAFVGLTMLILLRAIPDGDRLLLLVFAGGAIVFLYLRRSVRPKPLVILALACASLVLSTFLSDLRGRQTRDQSATTTAVNIAKDPTRIVDHLVRGPDSEMAPALAAALTVIPARLPHTYGATIFGDLIRRPVPRLVWPAKPVVPRIRVISEIWPAESKKGSINPEFSILLYLYWDFSYMGAVVGLCVCGIVARGLYQYLLINSNELFAQLLYSISLWFIVIGVRNSPVDSLILAVAMIGPLMAIFFIASRRRTLISSGSVRLRTDSS